MKSNQKNNRIKFLLLILLALLGITYKVMFSSPSEYGEEELENSVESEKVLEILREVEAINFDTSVMKDTKFQSLKSIDKPLISMPVGKKNPFSSSSK